MANIKIIQGDFEQKLKLQFAPGIKAGFPSPAEDYRHETLDFNRDLIRNPEACHICRLYAIDDATVILGRIVVLPENRGQGIGTLVVHEAERWAKELGFSVSVVESRKNKIRFYETLGYVADYSKKIVGDTFTCYRMEKKL